MPVYHVASHCRYYIKYHIVWIVKYRKELLVTDSVVKRLIELLHTIGESYELRVEEIGADGDHLHLFCWGLPKISPARTVEIFKSISARELMKEFPQLRLKTYGAGLWGVGYYLATVGYHTNEEAVRAYVRNQGKNKDVGQYTQLKIFI